MSGQPDTSAEERAYELPEIWQDGWFPAEDRERVRDLSALVPDAARTLVDVGCGNGLFLNCLAQSNAGRFERLVGVDRSMAALSHVRTGKIRARIDALPLDDGSFDVVTCSEVLEHLPVDVFPRAVSELSRVARHYVLVSVPYRQDLVASLSTCPGCHARFNADLHVRSFDEAAMGSLFEQHGLHPLSTHRLGEFTTYWDRMIRSQLQAWWRPAPAMPAYAICPVCGFHDREGLRQELARRESAKEQERLAGPPAPHDGALRKWATRLRPRVIGHRWICTLYARAQ